MILQQLKKIDFFKNLTSEFSETVSFIRLEKYNLIFDFFIQESPASSQKDYANLNIAISIPDVYKENKPISGFKVDENKVKDYLAIVNDYNNKYLNTTVYIDEELTIQTKNSILSPTKNPPTLEIQKQIQITIGILCILTIDLWIYKTTNKRSTDLTEIELLTFADKNGIDPEELSESTQLINILTGA